MVPSYIVRSLLTPLLVVLDIHISSNQLSTINLFASFEPSQFVHLHQKYQFWLSMAPNSNLEMKPHYAMYPNAMSLVWISL